ncbi:MAG: M48 family peptidase [Candidatus Kapaibacterium sp.]|nr:MAG: M48 family peptidase [Candidatus Kapabacteria bacterium]
MIKPHVTHTANVSLPYSIERRSVKHVRIRVSDDLAVRIVVPQHWSDVEAIALLEQKGEWIRRQQERFRAQQANKPYLTLHPHQIMLLGKRYQYVYSERLQNRVVVNHRHCTVQSGKDLLDANVQECWYKRFARAYIAQEAECLSALHGYSYNKLFIRSQQTKWGNCSPKGNISVNWRIIKAPEYVLHYVLLHELIHTKFMHHKQHFWFAVSVACPQYKKAQQWLEQYGKAL